MNIRNAIVRMCWPWRHRAASGAVDRAAQVSTIKQLGEAGTPSSLWHLLEYLSSSDSSVREAAGSSIAQQLDLVPPAHLSKLDESLRAATASNWNLDGWRRLTPEQVGAFADDANAWAMLGVSSFHPNGYVREKSVRILGAMRDRKILGFLLLRVNDWVAPIRSMAQSEVLARLTQENSMMWIQNLPLVTRLESCGRGMHETIVEAVYGLLVNSECRDALVNGITSGDRDIRRACFRVVERMPEIQTRPLLEAAIETQDPILRFRASQRLLRQVHIADLDRLCERFLSDHFMPVRRAALESAVDRGSGKLVAFLLEALVDRHASIRELARFHLVRRHNIDVRAEYIQLLKTSRGKRLAATILGLGEIGAQEDFDLIKPYLQSHPVQVCMAATVAVGRLAPTEALPFLLKALQGDSPGISRQAERALAPQANSVPYKELVSIFQGSPKPHVRRNTIRLLVRGTKWERLSPLISACGDDDPQVREIAKAAVEKWLYRYNVSFLQPTQRQVESAQSAMAVAGDQLSAAVRQNLTTLLCDWEKR